MTAEARTARRRRVTYPVANLRAEVAALETAVGQVMAKPRKEAVHELRSATRKVEAYLAVLEELYPQVPGLRAVDDSARRVKKLLGRVRRAAGRVRDIDLQRSLISECLQGGSTEKLRKEAEEIRAQLKVERTAEAEKLVESLNGHGRQLVRRLEALMQDLEPFNATGLSPVEQEVVVRGWYAERVDAARRMGESCAGMHRIRKAAKLARYMAESGLAERVVKEFRDLQAAGGRWHDLLTLRESARQRLGNRSEMAKLLDAREAAGRDAFAKLIEY